MFAPTQPYGGWYVFKQSTFKNFGRLKKKRKKSESSCYFESGEKLLQRAVCFVFTLISVQSVYDHNLKKIPEVTVQTAWLFIHSRRSKRLLGKNVKTAWARIFFCLQFILNPFLGSLSNKNLLPLLTVLQINDWVIHSVIITNIVKVQSVLNINIWRSCNTKIFLRMGMSSFQDWFNFLRRIQQRNQK